jgi:imidazolonepropionase
MPPVYLDSAKIDLGGALVTPALIDCHTHLVHGGDRAGEFEMRLEGATYEELARAGGGILSTVKATRAASDEELTRQSLVRLDRLLADGVAVVEIKSGYGLTIDDEIRMLRIARRLGDLRPVKIVTTWLAAHTLPVEYKDEADRYLDEVAIPGLERAAAEGLVDSVDGFCETIGFSVAQIARLFDKAVALSLPVRLHAEQLSNQRGAVLAAEYQALSVDHLEYLPKSDVAALAAAGTGAVLLPGAFYALRQSQQPPVAAMRDAGVGMSVATDCNPGSSPLSSLLLAMNLACNLFGLTPEEALLGTTREAALALGLGGEFGTLVKGGRGELAVWNVSHPAQLSYHIGATPLVRRISAMEAV